MKYRITDVLHFVIPFLVLCASLATFLFAYYNYGRADQKLIQFDEQTVDAAYIAVNDIYGREGTPALQELFFQPDSLDRMEAFHQFLSEEYDFMILQSQPLVTKGGMPYKNECRIDYGTEQYGENDKFGYSLQSLQVNWNAYETYKLSKMISSGDGLQETNFVQNEPNAVPVVLGYAYEGITEIGEKYPIEYYGKQITLQVVGFFQKEATLPFLNEVYFLDHCILMPSYHINYGGTTSQEEYIHKIIMSQQNWGYIRLENGDNYVDYQRAIEEKSKELALLYVTNEAYALEYIREVSTTLHSARGVFFLLSMLLYFGTASIILFVFIVDYNKHKMDYAIRLICGSSLQAIKGRIFVKLFLTFLMSYLTAIGVVYFSLGYGRVLRENIFLLKQAVDFVSVLVAGVVICASSIINFYINRNDCYGSIQKALD